MSTETTNFNLIKPAVNDPVDQDLWGGYLNGNFDIIDAQLQIIKDLALSAVPVGSPIPYIGTTAPSGYLMCYGQTIGDTGSGADVEGSDYETLFNLARNASPNNGNEDFASGDVVYIPDLRGRVIAGKDDMGGVSADRLTDQSGGLDGDTLGDTGGSETHQLTIDEMPSHTHNISNMFLDPEGRDDNNYKRWRNGSNHTTDATGGDDPHNNVQPTLILNYVIRYK